MKSLLTALESHVISNLGEKAYIGDEIHFGSPNSLYKIVDIKPEGIKILLPADSKGNRLEVNYPVGINLAFYVYKK